MREILFRGKRVDNGEWVYGDLEHNGKNIPKWVDGEEVIPETVWQYTGLKDKNGNKIFEGDIIKGSWNTVFGVYFDEDYLQYRAKEKSGSHHEIDYYGESYRLEVIGNVYDNPELLEVKNETDQMLKRGARRL